MANAYNGAPVTVYLDGQKKTVHQIDLQAWLDAGWSQDPENKSKKKS